MSLISSSLGSNFSLDYAKYQAAKASGGSFLDFLLTYDPIKSENSDESQFDSLFKIDGLSGILSPKAISALDANNSLDVFGSKSESENSFLMMDAQVAALKTKLLDAFKTRYETSEKDETVKAAKIAALYSEAASIKTPTRLLGVNF
jgi:hypothetical protein